MKNIQMSFRITARDLIPTDARSFYGKARVFASGGAEVLRSYETLVLYRSPRGKLYRLWDGWSATTGRHIKAFSGLNKAEYMALPLASFEWTN